MGPMGETRRDWHTKPSRKQSQIATSFSGAQERAPAFEPAMVSTSKRDDDDGGHTSTAKKDIIPTPTPTKQLKLRLFVGGLGPTVGPKDLQDRLAPLGQVHGIQMIDSKEDAIHRGFAYVDFEALSDASMQKLFSAYNGCKWKGGVLRVEKAKEHYTNRLSREWAEAEVAKTKAMESQIQSDLINVGKSSDKLSRGPAAREIPFLLTEPLKIPVPFSKKVRLVPPKGTGRHKRSFQYFPSLSIGELSQESSPQCTAKRQKVVHSENFQHKSGNATNEYAVDDAEQDEVDEIAVEVARERTRQLKLLQKLFPDDNEDTREEQEKSVDFLSVPNVSQKSNGNAAQQKSVVEKPSVHHEKLQDLPLRNTNKQSQEEEDSKLIANQKTKKPRVSFLEEVDAASNPVAKDSKLMTEENQRGESSERVAVVAKSVRPILKKTQNEPQAVKDHKNLSQDDEHADEDEDEGEESLEEEYFSSSRSPTPEGNLSEKSKWDRLFKHACVKKGDDVPIPCDGMFTGISLDDEEEEELAIPVSSDSKWENLLQGATGTGNSSDSTILDISGDPNLDLSSKSNNKSRKIKSSKVIGSVQGSTGKEIPSIVDDVSPKSAAKCDVVAEGGDMAIVSSASEEEFEDEELDDVSMEDPSESSSSGYEDVNEEIGSGEEDSEFSSDDYVDAELKSASPQALSEAAKASKWENMFKSAMSVGDESSQGGIFSGSLDDADVKDTTKDVSVRPRSSLKKTRMFQGAAAALEIEGNADDAPLVSKKPEPFPKEISHEAMISKAGQITEEKAITLTASKKKEDVGGHSGDDSEYASDLQKKGDNVGGNLLARFETEGITSEPSKSPRPQARIPQQGQAEDEVRNGLDQQMSTSATGKGSNLTLLAEENENLKWVQRATWKSLVGVDGRVAFSLKQVTGELDVENVTKKDGEAEPATTTEQPFTFNFNFARTQPDAPKAVWPPQNPVIAKAESGSTSSGGRTEEKKEDNKAGVLEGVDGCVFMKSTTAEKDWRASKSELRMDSKAKHKSAVRTMKKLRSTGGAR